MVLSKNAAQGRTAARARLLARAAELAYRQSDYADTVELAEESLKICREIGDQQGAASVLIKLANAATEAGDYSAASKYLEEALAIWRETEGQTWHGSRTDQPGLGCLAIGELSIGEDTFGGSPGSIPRIERYQKHWL